MRCTGFARRRSLRRQHGLLRRAAGAAPAHEAHEHPAARTTAAATAAATAALRLSAELAPLAARSAVTVTRAAVPGARTRLATARQDWYFFRDTQRVAVLKGLIDETWHRDAGSRLSFKRVFHD